MGAKLTKQLLDRGVSVHVGAHGQREGLAAHWEMWMLEQGGFTPWEAPRSATIQGARYLGMDTEIGSLESEKLAEMAIINGNPLQNLRLSDRVAYTMVNGRMYDTETMRQLGPESSERQPRFFELEGGDRVHADTEDGLDALGQRHGLVR
ncbi:MAG: amidohydrolase family protein [Acidobacteriota bacterium]|nr:amidohydrolase family protein [Acidobacteriota bacterium]